MSTVLLVRHGLTELTGPVLAGRTPGIHLDDRGRKQAAAVAERLSVLPLTAIVTSPMERCVDTAAAIRDAQHGEPATPHARHLAETQTLPVQQESPAPQAAPGLPQAPPQLAVVPAGLHFAPSLQG